jgi:hypothetical protein
MHRSLRLWTILTAGVALGTLALSACGITTSTTKHAASASATPTTLASAAGPFCLVPTPESWKTAIAKGQVATKGTWSRVLALSPSGDQMVEEVRRHSALSLELVSAAGKERFIVSIAHTDVGGYLEYADFDGRWVVYVLGYSQNIANRWTIYAWDSQSAAAPYKIAVSRSGTHWILDPDVKVHQGKATWVASPGTTDALEIHLFDLASHHDQIVEVGRVGPPFFADNLLAWPESKAPSDPLRLKAYDSVSGAMANLPDALKAIENGFSIAGNGRSSAWSGGATQKEIWMWHTGRTAPRKIFDAGEGSWVSQVQLTGNIVTWTGDATWAADLRSGSYVKLTPEAGGSMAKGTHLAFMYNTPGAKSEYTPIVSVVVDVSKLPPLPACPLNK